MTLTIVRNTRCLAALVAIAATTALHVAQANHYILPCRDKCGDIGGSGAAKAGAWIAIGPEGTDVVALAIDPSTPSTVFAGTLGAGVLKTTDGGSTWVTSSAGILSSNVSALAIDPAIPLTLYAGTDAGVFKSNDGGQSWSGANVGIPAAPQAAVTALAISADSSKTLYAGTIGRVYKSANGGATWTSSDFGAPTLTPRVIAIDPGSASTLYVGGDDYVNDSGSGVLKSTDAGETWTKVYTSTPYGDGGAPPVTGLVIDPRSSSRLYLIAGSRDEGAYYPNDTVLISSDAGATWSAARLPIEDSAVPATPVSLILDPLAPATICVFTYDGPVFRSTDAGAHWTSFAEGPAAVAEVAAITASTPATLLAGGGAGIFRSSDQAQTWTHVNLGVRRVGTFATAVDPVAPSTIYTIAGGIVAKTTDGGAHWFDASEGLAGQGLSGLAIDPLTPSTLYVLGSLLNKSTDAGAHWVPLMVRKILGPQTLAVAASQPSTLYAGVDFAGVFKSVDAGTSWTPVNDGFVVVGPYVSALAVDPTTADNVYVASPPTGLPDTEAKLFKSTEGGAHWRQVPIVLPSGASISSISIDPVTPSVIYASYNNYGDLAQGGMLKSIDAGETWFAAESGLPHAWIWMLAANPTLPSQLYAATNAGAFRSTNGGASWALFNSGLGTASVFDISVDRSGSLLRASTAYGLFEYRLSGSAAPSPAINYEGLWAAESGWALNVAHQGDTIFATWFTYDANGKAWWLTMTANKSGDSNYGGAFYLSTGPAFNALPFDSSLVTRTPVGIGSLSFSDARNGTFAYTVGGVTQSKAITLFAFDALPTCVWGAQPDPTRATQFQDLWGVSGESGWAVNLTQQGTTLFATWFVYGLDGNPLWYSATATPTGPRTFAGALIKTTGPPFSALPFDANLVQRTAVGTVSFAFSDGNSGTFSYQLNDGANVAAQTKTITRQVFVPPGTVCD